MVVVGQIFVREEGRGEGLCKDQQGPLTVVSLSKPHVGLGGGTLQGSHGVPSLQLLESRGLILLLGLGLGVQLQTRSIIAAEPRSSRHLQRQGSASAHPAAQSGSWLAAGPPLGLCDGPKPRL